ncbi:MAG TPA: hypothetical protein GYA10_09390 [Alphaproteobacteria bacterium]|nr:hypothetical protein [Alphaproteobacteria bacterium]
MADPFGGHPTLGRFMAWANQEHGFKCRTGTAPDRSGKQHPVVRIFKDDGPSVVVVGIEQDEHLSPTQVGNLERRLGVKSRWFSVDNDD